MRKEFKVASSDGISLYVVAFVWNGENLHVTCDCKAGALGQSCRHKEGLINGDRSLLHVDADMTEVLQWVKASPVGSAVLRLSNAKAVVKVAEAAAKSAKKALASEKKMLADLVNPRLAR